MPTQLAQSASSDLAIPIYLKTMEACMNNTGKTLGIYWLHIERVQNKARDRWNPLAQSQFDSQIRVPVVVSTLEK